MGATERRFRVMASDAHVIAVGAPAGALDRAQLMLEHLERCWSRFLPDSDVSRINVGSGRPVVVEPVTLTLISTMVAAWQATGGRYDPTVLPVLVAAGYGHSVEDPARVTALPPMDLRLGGMGDVAIDPAQRTVTVPVGVVLDPGGIGKGLAADLVVAELLAAGARGALVGIGGDLSCAGEPPLPDGWHVTIERPDKPATDLGTFAITGGGVATSSTRSRRWTHEGRPHQHVVDPATGTESRTDLAAVTVVARTGWLAEAHATAAILSGRAGILDHLRAHALSGVTFTAAGEVIATDDLRSLAVAVGTLP